MKTPFFRIKEADLLYDIHLLKRAMTEHWGNYVTGYSVKTNALPWLLTYLKQAGFYAEIVSETEYDLVRRLGYGDDKIIYNGPIKNKKLFERILVAGGYLNMDSTEELQWIAKLSGIYPGRHFQVGLRVNFDIGAWCPEEKLAEEDGGRFGYCYENGVLKQAIHLVQNLPNVKVTGLHLHTSTQSRSAAVYGALARMAGKLAEEYQLKLSYVDMGGGYFGGRDDMPGYPDYFKEIGTVLREFFDPGETRIIAEPGISLVSRATTFETTVKDVKAIRAHRYLVTDGSRTNLNPLVTRHVYPHTISYNEANPPAGQRETVLSQWVCGFTCMEYDRLFEITDGKELLPGDRVIYQTAGGYTMCLNPLFIQYLPAVYIERKDGSIFIAREAWGNDEYLQKNAW